MTSSNTRSAPERVAAWRSASRNPSWAAIRPPLTATGSHRIAATADGCSARIRSTEAMSFHWATTTSANAAGGIPGVAGTVAGRSAGPDRPGSKPVLANTPSNQP